MEYVEFRRARKSLTIFAFVAVGLLILVFVGNAIWSVGHGGVTHVRVSLGSIFGIAGYCAIVCATALSTSLSKENDGVDFVFTKPISREHLALRYMAIDAGAILIAFVGACVVAFGTLAALGLLGHLTSDGQPYWIGALGLGIAFMWYGLLQAATASFTGNKGMLVGGIFAIFGVFGGLSSVSFGGPAAHAVLHVLNVFNPLAFSFALVETLGFTTVGSVIDLPIAPCVAVASAFGALGCVIAIQLWKRVEA